MCQLWFSEGWLGVKLRVGEWYNPGLFPHQLVQIDVCRRNLYTVGFSQNSPLSKPDHSSWQPMDITTIRLRISYVMKRRSRAEPRRAVNFKKRFQSTESHYQYLINTSDAPVKGGTGGSCQPQRCPPASRHSTMPTVSPQRTVITPTVTSRLVDFVTTTRGPSWSRRRHGCKTERNRNLGISLN